MVSVILVNHNYSEYVGQAIESVLNQTYRDFELIVIDGASTDHSRKVIMSYVDKYPDIITAVFKPTSGQAAGFNMGYRISRGDIIAFLDADDYFAENKLERIVEFHDAYNFVGTGRSLLRNGKIRSTHNFIDDYEQRPYLLKKFGYIYTYNLITSCISMNRNLADQIFPMPEKNYVTFADCYVKVFAQYLDNIKFMDEPLSIYRVHGKQDTMKKQDSNELTDFCRELYQRVFSDINEELYRRGEKIIPDMTIGNFKKAFLMANNHSADFFQNQSFIMYGTGARSHLYLNAIEKVGGNVDYAIDGDEKKWGKRWENREILSPDEGLRRRENRKVIIGSTDFQNEIEDVLIQQGLYENKDYFTIGSVPND